MIEVGAEMDADATVTAMGSVPKRRTTHRRRAIIDSRTYWAKRRVELIEAFTAELGHVPSDTEAVLITNAAAMTVRVEQLTGRVCGAKGSTTDGLTRAVNAVTRTLLALGIGDAPPPAPPQPSIGEYVKARYGA